MAHTIKLVLDNGFEKKLAAFENEEDARAFLTGFQGGRGFVQAILSDSLSCQEALDLGYELGQASPAHYGGFLAGQQNEEGNLEVE